MTVDSLLLETLRVDTLDAQDFAAGALRRYYADVRVEKTYCYARGTLPVLLVAHTDTVHATPPTTIYHDPEQGVLWSPEGLGADDRAGVYTVLSLLRQGHRPHVLFTDGEERGGIGADDAAYDLPRPDVRCMVQFDRAGANDAVYYSCDSRRMRRWVNRFGWTTAQGTFTDIAVLMPAWGVAGVNLSVGYYAQHTASERLHLGDLADTIRRASLMLSNPPGRRIGYHTRDTYTRHAGRRLFPMSDYSRDYDTRDSASALDQYDQETYDWLLRNDMLKHVVR